MDIRFIERLIELVERSTLAELEYGEGGERIRIVKTPAGVTTSHDAPPLGGPEAAPERTTQSHRERTAQERSPGRTHFVTAGIVGTFYRSASPAEPVFVDVGQTIEEGQTLGLVEAMKTFNPVEADRAGKIVGILVADGAAVEPGTLLFEIDVG